MKRERGTGGLFKLKGSRFWYAQFYDVSGKPCRVSTRTDVKQEAQAILRNLMTDKDRGGVFVSDIRKITYGELREGLLQNYVERGNRSLLTQADGTETINGLNALDSFFGYEGKDKPGATVDKITTDAARKFAQQRLASGRTNSTVNTSLACLRRMLNIAHEDRKLQFVPKIRLLKPNPARKGFLPRDKFQKLLLNLPSNLQPLVVFLYFCGVRLGEALQVEWSQVDLKEAMIRLEDDQTKTREARIVPLPDVLVEMLSPVKVKKGLVFDSVNLRRSWAKACSSVGLGELGPVDEQNNQRYTGLLIHDLRRSAIKNLMKAGVSEKVAMAISGHKTRSVFDRYHIVDVEDVVTAMRRVQRMKALRVPRKSDVPLLVSESSVQGSQVDAPQSP